MKKVLLPYFHAGNGHLAFARAIRHHLAALRPHWQVELFDAGAAFPDTGLQDRFVEDWKRILALPGIIKHTAFAIEPMIAGITERLVMKTIAGAVDAAADYLKTWQGDLILPTHWGCSHLFSLARERAGITAERLPIWYLYTEFGRAYKLITCGADRYFTLSEESARDLERVGVHPSAMEPVDLFIPPELEHLPDQASARRQLDLDPDCFTVMFSLGGEGIGRIRDFLLACRLLRPHAQFVVICGRNEELVASIKATFPDSPGLPRIRPLGYQPNLGYPLAACDIVAGKCGTTTAMESIMLHKPLIVCQGGALNEQDNKDYIVRHGFGWYQPRPLAFARFVAQLANPASLRGKDRLAACRRALRRHPSKNGALDIAEYVVSHLSSESLPIAE